MTKKIFLLLEYEKDIDIIDDPANIHGLTMVGSYGGIGRILFCECSVKCSKCKGTGSVKKKRCSCLKPIEVDIRRKGE